MPSAMARLQAQPPERQPLALELLVHGVGGATPEGMLNDPRVKRMYGDDTAAVYRRDDDADAEDRAAEYAGRAPVREAYCWSNLTSGDGRRALWLLLVPFMIVNLAHWMRPRHDGARWNWLYDAVLRLIALTLTVLLVLGACEVAMDLLAWQCADKPHCASGKHWLVMVNSAQHGWWSEPGRRLVLGAIAPLLLVGGLWWLSRHTWWAYETVEPTGAGRGRGGPLAREGFWFGCREVARLRAAHTASGLLVVAAVLWTPAFTEDLGGSGVPRGVGWALAGALLMLAVAVAVLVVAARRDEDQGTVEPVKARRDRRLMIALYAAALTVLAGSAVYAAWHRPGWHSAGHGLLPVRTLCYLTLAQGGLVLFLGALTTRVPGRRAGAMRGFGGPAVALLACALGALFTSGAVQRMADWLDKGGAPGAEGDVIDGPPVLLTWQASVLPGVVLVLAAMAASGVWLVWRGGHRLGRRVEAEYPQPPGHPKPYDEGRTRHIARAQAVAGLTDRSPLLLTAIVVAALVLGSGALVGAWVTGQAPGAAAANASPWIRTVARGAQAGGSWLLGAATIALIALGRRAYRSAAARRTVGILWDIGTFWPRAAHPFAPPCYAERAVPDISARLTQWTDRHPDNRIVLSGHSQGSVLAAAAAWQLSPATRDRVALLTYGSPLARLYGRWFPAFFGPDRLSGFHEDVHAWCNLWRRTDPIGGETGIPGVDRRLADPLAYRRDSQNPLIAPVLGHSHYPDDPEFAETRTELVERLTPAACAPAADPPLTGVPVQVQGSAGRSSG